MIDNYTATVALLVMAILAVIFYAGEFFCLFWLEKLTKKVTGRMRILELSIS